MFAFDSGGVLCFYSLHAFLELLDLLVRGNHPNEQKREEGAGEADSDQDPVLRQIFLRHTDPLIIDPRAYPASNVTSEVRYSSQEGEACCLDMLWANLCHDNA